MNNISKIKLRHVSGKLILERQINTGVKSLNINTSNIGEDIYILNIINENGIVESKKLVISH